MGINFNYISGQTPLEEDEKSDLIIKVISTQQELDEFEQQNIEDAISWTLTKPKLTTEFILSEKFIKELHRQMFGNVWKWAGKFRLSNKNLGIDKEHISTEIHKLLEDCRYWIDNQTFSPEEIAIRFKHRLVSIHPFANGNGRHSRLMADVLVSKGFGLPVFSWGGISLAKKSDIRSQYLHTLQSADNKDYDPLLRFARQK